MAQFPKLNVVDYSSIRQDLQSGDILLASGQYIFSKLIQKATNSVWSHVAFVMKLDAIDRVMVLESIEGKGVRTIPLSEYVDDFEGTNVGYNGRLAIARHSQFQKTCTPDRLKKMAQFAVDRFAYPYDEEEIARITARIVASALGFKKNEIKRDKEYICSEYVFECYKQVGIDILYDKRGFVAPADFANDPSISLLYELEVKGDSDAS